MTNRATGTFEVKLAPETDAPDAPVGRMSIDKQFQGDLAGTSVLSSGRITVDVVVELIQGTHNETLLKLRLKGNELGFFDPRKRYETDSVTLTSEMLSKLQPGSARLRSVAIGRHQWFRLPPPTVREVDVVIQKQSGG